MSQSGQSNRRIVACVVLEAPAPRKPADMLSSGGGMRGVKRNDKATVS